jgi:hypothetical protein
MSQHSEGYLKLKQRLAEIKNQPVNIITPAPIVLDRDTALKIFRTSLHDMVNQEYQHDHGISEDENELLHCFIEGVELDD